MSDAIIAAEWASELAARISAPMPVHRRPDRGNFRYITGEQCISRLNEALGINRWDFTIQRIWWDKESDCVICHGRLTVSWPDGSVSVHDDIGGQKPNRNREGDVLELSNDYKGARTDCLKRCAADIGIALDLYHKEDADDRPQPVAMQPERPKPQPVAPQPEVQKGPVCGVCGTTITDLQRKGRPPLTVDQLVTLTLSRYSQALCGQHYRERYEAEQQRQASNNPAPAVAAAAPQAQPAPSALLAQMKTQWVKAHADTNTGPSASAAPDPNELDKLEMVLVYRYGLKAAAANALSDSIFGVGWKKMTRAQVAAGLLWAARVDEALAKRMMEAVNLEAGELPEGQELPLTP